MEGGERCSIGACSAERRSRQSVEIRNLASIATAAAVTQSKRQLRLDN